MTESKKTLRECYPEVADDPNEVLVADVRKHWIGHVGIWLIGIVTSGLLLGISLVTAMFAKNSGLDINAGALSLFALVVIVVAGLILVGTAIADWVYGSSHMLITNENVIEMRQISLFSKKTSHLNMINVEDVTVHRRGILQTILNYGSIVIQTAGELENFNFTYTPGPDEYRRYIIEAHEAAIARTASMGTVQKVEIARNNL